MKVKIRNRDRETDIEFPCTESELHEKLKSINIQDELSDAVYVSEVTYPSELSAIQDRFINLDELNYLAKRMDSFDAKECMQFYEAVKHTGMDTVKDYINLTFNLDKFTLIRDIGDMASVGRAYLLNTQGCLPADDTDNPKYATVGWELLTSGKGIFTERGLMFVSDRPMEEVYDGTVFPSYQWSGDSLVCAEIDYNGKQETVYLPDENLAITKALKRLGAPSIEVCAVGLEMFSSMEDDWADRIQEIINKEGVFEANGLLRSLGSLDADWDKLTALVDSMGAKTAANIAILADHIDDFGFIGDVDSPDEVGHYFVENDDDYGIHPDMEEFFDFSGFGEFIADEKAGKFISGGFIYYDGPGQLEDLLESLDSEGEKMNMGEIHSC